MKKVSILLTILLFCATSLFAQKLSFQAVVRNSANELVPNATLTVAVSVLDASNNVQYSENHTGVQTNQNGLLSLMVGDGTPTSGTTMADVIWSGASIQTVITLPGGATITNTTPVNAVPYALSAGNVDPTVVADAVADYLAHHSIGGEDNVQADWNETDPTSDAYVQHKPSNVSAFTNDAGYITKDSIPANVSEFNNDANYVTTTQLNAANYITAADIPAQVNADWNATSGAAQIMNKPTIPTVPANVSEFNNDAGYLTSYTEQQVLSISNDTIFLTGGSFVKLPARFSGSYNDLTDVPDNVSTFNNDAGYLTRDSLGNYNLSPEDIQLLLDRIAALEQQMEIPILNTAPATNIGNTSAVSGGTVVSSRLAVTVRGVCWSTTGVPTISNNFTTDGSGIGDFTSSLSSLTPATTYYVRAYATNDAGTGYGPVITFTTLDAPAMETSFVDNISGSAATVHCSVVTDNGANITEYGICWNTSGNPTISDQKQTAELGSANYTVTLTSLTPASTYYVRAYATNSVGTGYGDVITFVTAANLPTITTTAVSAITATSATSGGNVTSDGGATVTARGVCWSTSHNPTISGNHTTNGTGAGSFTSSITGLSESTTYYVRAYATNSEGTAYGVERSFTTPASFVCGTSTITDIDGNTYNTVQIGSQCWMKQNLKTTKYSDGTQISRGGWSTTTPYWYYPNFSSSNKSTYGLVYNWTAVMRSNSSSNSNPSGVKGICPTGWHVPSDAEWNQMTNYVSSQSAFRCGNNASNIGKALAATSGWNTLTDCTCCPGYNQSANNATGFGAMPAGSVGSSLSVYYNFGMAAEFWSATQPSGNPPIFYEIRNSLSTVRSNTASDKGEGKSVRCVKN